MYEVLEASYQINGEAYTGYGIKCGEGFIADLSLEREAVKHLARLCNEQALHPCHLAEIAQDFLEA